MTKFHTSLTKLVSLGLVGYDKDPRDGRSKLYYVSERTHNVLTVLHEQVFEWLERRQAVLTHLGPD